MALLRSRLDALGEHDFALFARGAGAGRVSALLATETMPMALLILLGGMLADRFAPRPIMVAADLLRAAAQSVLAMLLTGPAPFAAVLVLAALIGTGNALDAPGRNRLLTQIVTPGLLPSASGTLMLATSTAGLLGPVLGGLFVGGVGAGWAIALDAPSYLASALLLCCP